MSQPSKPMCPNHGVELEIPDEDLMKGKGAHPCPVSKCLFEWQVDVEIHETHYDKFGNELTSYKTNGKEI
jgi:hypothetical protein